MDRLSTHIDQLLHFHDCVVVPSLGAFVLQTVPFNYDQEQSFFSPSCKEVSFNASIQHADGLLATDYQLKYKLTYEKAMQMIVTDVKLLVESLKKENTILFGNIGSFSLGNEGQLVFMGVSNNTYDINVYGLVPFKITPLRLLQERTISTKGKSSNKTVYIPISRRFMHIAATSAAAVLFLFLSSVGLHNHKQTNAQAGLVPNILMEQTFPSLSLKNPIETEKMVVEMHDFSKVPEKAFLPESIDPSEFLDDSKPKKEYYAIIASFPEKQKALEFLSELDNSIVMYGNIIESNGRYRVYAAKYDNKDQTETYLKILREKDLFKDPWMLAATR